jgi:hypothetical protein
MADLDRRAMLGLSAAAMAGSLAACTETPRLDDVKKSIWPKFRDF